MFFFFFFLIVVRSRGFTWKLLKIEKERKERKKGKKRHRDVGLESYAALLRGTRLQDPIATTSAMFVFREVVGTRLRA